MVSDRLVDVAMAVEAWVEGVKDEYGMEYARGIIDEYNVTPATMKVISEMQCMTPADDEMLEYIDMVLELDNDTA